MEIFGPEKAFLPMTLDGAMRDSRDALEIGLDLASRLSEEYYKEP